MTRWATEWLDWRGATSRAGFVAFALPFLAFAILAQPKLGLIQGEALRTYMIVALGLAGIAWVGFAVRRLHDMGRNGAWVLLGAIPFVGLVILVWLMLARPAADRGYRPSPRWLVRLAVAALWAFALLCLSRLFWAPYWIPSGNMKPTLLVGDFVIVERSNAAPEAGDVVVFRHPLNGTDFVKRVMAVGGDTIQLMDGQVVLNKLVLKQTAGDDFVERFALQGSRRVQPVCANGPVQRGGDCVKQRFAEQLPSGRSYDVLNIRDGRFDNTDVFTVPGGHFFVLGDNRDNSLDSRFPPISGGVGFVPNENVVGYVRRVLFSGQGASLWSFWTWRQARYWSVVR